MPPTPSFRRRLLLTAVAAAFAGALAGPASAHWSPPAAPLAHLDVYDRVTGSVLDVHEHEGRRYIVGVPGHEYALRIRNLTGRRILAVTSVDGVNVVTGDTASPGQSGYVIEPWDRVEIAGWRKSLSRTAAFYFTEHANSYAARTGRPLDVGVIGVAVFAEKAVRIAQRIDEPLRARREAAAADAQAPAPATAPVPEAADSPAESRRDESVAREQYKPQPAAKLGTGHGRNEVSHARQVAFERATSAPAQMIAVQYDRYENLVAMGVLPSTLPLAHRTPRPFPGMRFAPDPR
jgi:hypothetical protein